MLDDSTAQRVDAAWDRIESWLRTHAPATYVLLGAYATQEEIDDVQQRMSVTFPPSLVASLLRHNGLLKPGVLFPPFFTSANLSEIHFAWQTNTSVLQQCGPGEGEGEGEDEIWWDQSFIPFALAGDGGCLVLAQDGRIGEFFAEDGTDFDGWPAGLTEFLEQIADSLETGDAFDHQHGFLPVVFDGELDWEAR